MPTLNLGTLTAAILLTALTIYALTGGADYGAGVWDLLASGPRAKEQRALIEEAIGPIWETNHVWLIIVVVLLFAAFPIAFTAVFIALHVPLTLMLLGIVLRGCAFTFRHYDARSDRVQQRWGRIFALASLITPILLGICLGSIASGSIRGPGGVLDNDYIGPWLQPLPILVGLLALALFAYLAAAYLAVEAPAGPLKDDFRIRALWAGAGSTVLTLGVSFYWRAQAPWLEQGLSSTSWWWMMRLAAALAAAGAFTGMWRGRSGLARALSPAQVGLTIVAWALAQLPYIVPPDLTVSGTAAPNEVLGLLLAALGVGGAVLFPSLFYLFWVFKGR